jgi:hypothetical protein
MASGRGTGGSGSGRRRRPVWAAVSTTAAAAALAVLAGCSSSNDSAGSAGGAASEPLPAAGSRPGGTGEAAGPADAGGARDAGGGAANRSDATGTRQIQVEQPALIRTAEMTVQVGDVAAKARQAQDYARAAGGAVAGDDRSGAGDRRRADLVLRVRPERLDGVLDQLGALGEEQQRSSSTEDVTEQVADVQSRVATMQASIARVRAILSRATRIGDVVAVEGELSRRTTELESLQTKQRALAGQTALATVTLHLVAKGVPVAAPPADRGGFVGGLQKGWDAFTAAVGWVLTALGALLPFLIVLVPLALAVRWYAQRRRPAQAPTASAPPPAAAS